ncbi:Phosphorylcholine metabolism protein LicD [Butyrivibrio proteoclasticus]|uniref:Phosphorylcholine metabolism protein LicD n=1 Tax=Butyrivibrio proteoclasticus TaxID=43305 RepID=A0A1I5VTH6_9FIRM|nr:LicD family protein [Butyrivibrio proteoclasticus]SFQ10894.1 Phosphorylcholine metabolism protein LicD [Butyrivibrio proteoclasticus]
MHSIDFFRDEVRNGFYIPTAVKQSWACCLDVLAEIDRICTTHDINYYADWGTLLGAVRHGGIIPWDDDIDICMKRDDYIKFRAVADDELPSEYVIHDYERHEDHWLFLSRIVNNAHYGFTEDFLNRHYNFPWLASVDIFVKDYLYDDYQKEKERCQEIMHILVIAENHINKGERKKAIELYKKAEQIMGRVNKNDSNTIGQIFPWILKGQQGEPKACYEPAIRIPFEDTTIPVPSHYHELLSKRYGNYNEIHKGVAGHGYPSFDNQRITFEEATGKKLPAFTFSKDLLKRNCCTNKPTSRKIRRTILFLPIGPKEWKGFKNTYEKESASNDADVFVMPLPLLFKDYFGRITMTDQEIVAASKIYEYPQNLNLLSWADTDIGKLSPDIIYIQNPYDNMNPLLTVPEYFYSGNLQKFAPRIVYIPIAQTADFSDRDEVENIVLKFYVTMPALFHADEVWVQYDNIRLQYAKKLIDFSGDDTKEYWNAKIKTVPDLY